MIRMINVHKAYNKNCIPLKNINLHIAKGEIVVLCGPSGAGKSTLLKTINRIEPIDSGQIFVDGKSLHNGRTNLTALRADIGMVFQHFNLYPHMTVLENITLAPRKVRGYSRKEADAKALDLLRKFDLSHKYDKYPIQLSGGEQQRVAIIRSLAMEPKIMLFDEPTSALDPELINDVLADITKLAANGMTMMIITHEMNFAQRIAHRVIFMELGEILEAGSPVDMFMNPHHPRTKEFFGTVLHV